MTTKVRIMMKNLFNTLLCLLLVIFCISGLTSCGVLGKNENKVTTKLNAVNTELDEEKKALTKATSDALKNVPSDVSTNNVVSNSVTIAKITADKNVGLHGLPVNPINVTAMVTAPVMDKTADYKQLLARFDREQKLLEEKAIAEREREALRNQLVELGKKYEEEQNKSLITRIWAWTMGTLGIGGLIALVVLCPALLPLFGSVISWLIGAIPPLANFFGVVGKKVAVNVMNGVESFKDQLKNAPIEQELLRNIPEDKAFSKAEVLSLLEEHSERNLELLRTQLSKATTPDGDRNIINYFTHRKM